MRKIVVKGPQRSRRELPPPLLHEASIAAPMRGTYGMEDELRLSVVVTSRNDDHGRGMLRRFRLFAEGLVQQAERHDLTGELIVVEWNPPKGARLHEVLDLRVGSERFPVRFIEVPPELHASLPNADAHPLFQMIAKNVGIRRARGRFVLATNPDLLFSDELVRFIAQGHLRDDRMYRIDRTDVATEVPDASLDVQIEWCRAHVLRTHTRWGSFPNLAAREVARRALEGPRWAARRALALLSADRERRASPPLAATLRRLAAAPLALALRGLRTLHYVIDPKPKVHTNGCGDFTLLSREAWHRLRAYPELPIWSMHLDSLLCYMAVASGYHQHLLAPPARLYHIEHESSWVVMDLEEKLRTFTRKPWLDSALLEELWKSMAHQHRAVVYNDEKWGFAGYELSEVEWARESALRLAASSAR